jgi:hypothetical protein
MIDWLEFFVRVSVNEYCLSQEFVSSNLGFCFCYVDLSGD